MLDLARTAAIRAVKTFAQTLGAMLTAAGTGLLDTDWLTSLSVAGMAALLSVLTTVGGEYVPSRNDRGFVSRAAVYTLGAIALILCILALLGVRFDLNAR